MTSKALLVIGAGLAVVSMKFAGQRLPLRKRQATLSTARPRPSRSSQPFECRSRCDQRSGDGFRCASADAKGSLGNSSPVSSVCQQNASGSDLTDGATVNASGSESAYSRSATDGNVTASITAVPQYKAQQMAIAIA